MPVRISPADRIRGHIDELFAQDRPLPEILEEMVRAGAQLLMQAALEAEVTEFLSWDRYARAALTEDARPGSRSGYRGRDGQDDRRAGQARPSEARISTLFAKQENFINASGEVNTVANIYDSFMAGTFLLLTV